MTDGREHRYDKGKRALAVKGVIGNLLYSTELVLKNL